MFTFSSNYVTVSDGVRGLLLRKKKQKIIPSRIVHSGMAYLLGWRAVNNGPYSTVLVSVPDHKD